MSSIVASFCDDDSISLDSQYEIVKNGLSLMSSRSPGFSVCLKNYPYPISVLGFREHCSLAKHWSAKGAYQEIIDNQTISLIISGYIDNADEIAKELKETKESCNFSVANLLFKAYLQKDCDFINHYNIGGSFAIVITDGRKNKIHIIRDRLGIEPLYFWLSNHSSKLIVASEPKCIINFSEFEKTFKTKALCDLLNSTSRIPGQTVYAHLKEVRPGELITFYKGKIYQNRYWSLPGGNAHTLDHNEIAYNLNQLMTLAVNRRFDEQDTNTAFLLSGGLDSSIICAVANQHLTLPLKTFSFNYPDENTHFKPDALHITPDSPYVDVMTKALDSRHTQIVIDNNDFKHALLETIQARDLPGVGDLDITLLWLFKHLKNMGQTRVFSGEGADDIFGGYPWFSVESTHYTHHASNTFPWLKETNASKFIHPQIADYFNFDEQINQRWSAVNSEFVYGQGDHMDSVFYMELTRFLPFLLDRADRMSAAAGIRLHLPYLDHRLIEYAWSIDYKMKSFNQIEKGILRLAFSSILPQQIAWRKKSGFAVNQSRQYISVIRNYLNEIIQEKDSVLSEIINVNYLKSYINNSQWSDGKFSTPPILPRIVMLDLWIKNYGMQFKMH